MFQNKITQTLGVIYSAVRNLVFTPVLQRISIVNSPINVDCSWN